MEMDTLPIVPAKVSSDPFECFVSLKLLFNSSFTPFQSNLFSLFESNQNIFFIHRWDKDSIAMTVPGTALASVTPVSRSVSSASPAGCARPLSSNTLGPKNSEKAVSRSDAIKGMVPLASVEDR